MNVCFCTARVPYPPIAGGRVETFRLVQGLVDHGHDVTVVALGDDETASEMAANSGARVRAVQGDRSRSTGRLVRNLASREPLPIMKFREGPLQETVTEVLAETAFDVLHLHTLQTSYLSETIEEPIPRVVRFTNIKSIIFRQFAGYTTNPAKAAYSYLQYLKTKRYERGITASADLTLAITDEDRDFLRNLRAPGRVETLPAGIDTASFEPGAAGTNSDSDAPIITFFGSMDYHPNEDAALWFTEEIWPWVAGAYPDATLELVGKDPSDEVRALAEDPAVTVTGFVEDITEWVDRATVVVIPIRVGTGVRVKVLHAMAMGKPIVSTTAGIQGIDVEDGTHASIRGDPAGFARAVGELLGDPDVRSTFGTNARSFVEANHGYRSIVEELTAWYRGIQ